MFNKKRIVVAVVFILFMFCFITFAGGTPQNQAIATRNVTFIDSYNNSEISAQRVVVGEDAEVPENPRHDRLVFAGWYLDSDRDTRITNFTNITDNITVVALYGADINGNGVIDEDDATYTVTFRDSVTDTVIATREVLVGMNAVPPTAPIHAGLTFTGWDASYSNVRRDTTVNAVYRTTPVVDVNRYTVTFRDGLDNSVVATVEVEEGLTATAPAAPAHEGYVFVRWDGDLDNITEDSEITGIYAVDSNGNGEADETEERYTVSYKSLIEGTKNEAPKHENSFLTNERYTVLENTFALDKAVFIGWTTDEDSAKEIVVSKEEERKISLIKAGSTATIGNENVIYYAVWAKNVNASTGDTTPDYDEAQYDLNIVDGDNTTTTKHVEGETVALPEGTDKSETVKFYGWSTTNHGTLTKEDKGTKVVTLDEVTFAKADITVYAVYAKYNETTGKYEFEDEQYTVTYESALEATGTTVDTEKYVLGEEYTIADNNFTKDESLFLGWTTSEDIAKVLVETEEDRTSAGELIAEGSTATMDGNVTYYAVWAANRDGDDTPDYKETHYDLNVVDGDNTTTTKHVEGETVVLPEGSDKSETVKFYGWSTTNHGTLTKEDKGTKVVTLDEVTFAKADITVYAVYAKYNETTGKYEFEDEQYTVTYESVLEASGSTVDDAVYVEGDTYDLMTNGFVKEDAMFLGWTTNRTAASTLIKTSEEREAAGDLIAPGTTVTVEGNATYYAVWAANVNGDETPDYREDHFEVTYDSALEATGSTSDDKTYVKGEEYTVKSNGFAIEKALFQGWTTDIEIAKVLIETQAQKDAAGTLVQPADKASMLEGGVTYYAVWAADKNGDKTPDYEETHYDLNVVDGDNITTTKHVEGETVVLPEGSDKSETVKFYGWSTTDHGTLTKEDKGTKVVTLDEVTFAKEDITVYAVYAKYNETTGKYEFEDEQYTVTYESALEATGTTVDAEKYVLGEEYTIADNNFTKDESLFLGWTTSEDIAKVLVETEEQRESAGTLVAEGSTATIDGNVTYYAVWAANRDGDDTPDYEETHYGVTYESTLTATGSTEDDKTYVAGEEFTVKSNGFEKDKALFLGWTTDANVANVLVETKEQKTEVGTLVQPADKASMLEGGVVYYAVWAADRDGNGTIDADEKITVNYEVDAIGNASLSKTSESLMPGTKITFPTVTLDDGYEYAWYEGNTKVTSATVKAGETTRTFTAKVTLIDYTVTFDYANDRDTNVTKNDYHYGDTIVIPSNPGDYRDESKLYVFKGWFIDGKAMTEKDKTVTGNKTFTARYDEYELPNLIATPSTTAWTKDDVTVKLTSNKEVKKYYVRVNGGEWKEFTPSKNGYTATTKCVVEFKILDKDGLESLPTKPIEIKIDKTSPVIVSPANKATINANGEPEVNLNIKIKETESGLVKNSDGQMIVYYLPKKIDSVSSFKKELEKAEGKPYLVVDKNGNATLDVIIDGDYTFYAVDAAGNEVANVTTVSITGIKESGITDEGEKNVPKTAVTLHIGKTVYGHDGLIIKNSPSRSVTITANEGYEVETIRWSVGRKNKKYFQDGNGTPGSLDTSILLENKDTSGGSVYTIYTKSKNTETGEIVEDIEYIYAYSKFWFLWYHNY